ncbi:MAG TPA: DUF1328 family protein, partial [Caulobacteraceae bacterium]
GRSLVSVLQLTPNLPLVLWYVNRIISLGWALTFFILAVVAGLLGFVALAGIAAEIAKILFLVFLVLLVVSFIIRAVRGQSVV